MKRSYPKLCHEKRRKRNNNPGTNGLRLVLSSHALFFLRPGRMVGTGFFSIEKRESFSFFFKNLSSKCLSQMNTFFKHRVIILNRGSMPRNRTGGITTSQRDVTRDQGCGVGVGGVACFQLESGVGVVFLKLLESGVRVGFSKMLEL